MSRWREDQLISPMMHSLNGSEGCTRWVVIIQLTAKDSMLRTPQMSFSTQVGVPLGPPSMVKAFIKGEGCLKGD